MRTDIDLLTFDEVRRRTRGLLSEARDWLHRDWSDDDVADAPSFRQARAMRKAAVYIDAAKQALDEAARRPEDES